MTLLLMMVTMTAQLQCAQQPHAGLQHTMTQMKGRRAARLFTLAFLWRTNPELGDGVGWGGLEGGGP